MSRGEGSLGFIGLGAMGSAMCRSLMRAGRAILGYDIDAGRLAASVDDGVSAAGSGEEIVSQADVVLTSLRSSAIWAEVAETVLLPNAREGQLFIDLGTVAAPETRRLAAAIAEKGAALVDAPVSGGPHGSETGTLRIFVGGNEAPVARAMPILQVLGEEGRVVHCGQSGAGQVVKGCNQLAMGIADAAYMEALAFGAREGIDPRAIAQAVGGGGGWRGHFSGLAERIAEGQGDTCCIKYPEYPYFLAEADEAGTPMPITRAIAEFASKVPSAYRDNMDRPTISFWRELMTREVVDPRRATAEHSGGTEPWQRFSSRARRAVVLAHNEAMGMGMPLVDTEHVLMGLVSLGEGAATEVLEGLGVALDRLAADLRDHLVHGSAAQEPNRELAFTPQAQRVLHVAYAESKRLEHDHVGTEHLLIGLVHEGRGAANRLLRKYGVDLTRVRAGVCRLHEGA